MAIQIQHRRDTAANWTAINPTLAEGELGFETDTGKCKLGTGLIAWNSLAYFILGVTPQTTGFTLSGGLTTSKTLTVALDANVSGTNTGDNAANSSITPTSLGLVIGTNVQAYDADLTTWAGVTPGAGVTTFLATPTIANLNSAVSDADVAILGANTFTGAQVHSDQQVSRAMILDCGFTVVDKGNSSTTTQTYDYTAGSVQTSTATGNHTIATSNWPPTGNLGELLIILTNGGAYTLTWPTISWIKPDGTTTTSIATYLAANTGRTALQTSGVDQILLWSRDAGTTIYGKLI